MPEVLITGANGFVGSSLCGYLYENGFSVTGLTRSSSTSQSYTQNKNLDLLKIHDISDIKNHPEYLAKVDVVVHLAARVHIMKERAADPLSEFRKANVQATSILARTAINAGVKRFIFLSTIGVNGRNSGLGTDHPEPFTEKNEPAPHSPYAVSKYEAETELKKICKDKMELTIIRPPMIYGPGVKGNCLRLLKLLDKGLPLPLGNSSNLRSFLSLENLNSFILRCCTGSKAADETFLVSDGKDVPTTEFIRMISEGLKKRSLLYPFPNSLAKGILTMAGKSGLYDQLWGSLQIDISKARNTLDWEPSCSMEEGLKETCEWYKHTGY